MIEDAAAARHDFMESVAAALNSGSAGELFANNPLAMWVYDVESLRILEANEAASARYGYGHADFVELTLRDIRPIEDVPKFLELTHTLPHFDRSGPWRHRKADGSVIQVLISSHAIQYGKHNARLVVAEDPDQATV